MPSEKFAGQAHYEIPGLLDRIDTGLRGLGLDPAQPPLQALAAFDEFHIRGAEATDMLINELDPQPGQRILDIGSGLGGPARRLASARDVEVVGVDLSPLYCSVASALTARVGLSDRVKFYCEDIAELAQVEMPFDAAWSIHVGMNVPQKAPFYRSIADCLEPGAPLLIYDMTSNQPERLEYPLPWANAREQSYIGSREDLEAAVVAGGFDIVDFRDDTSAAAEFLNRSVKAASEQTSPSPLGLHTVLGPRFQKIVPNMLAAFKSGALGVTMLRARLPE